MSILESLKSIEKKSFLEDKPYLGLVNLYEGIGNKLDSREKNELKKLVSNTDDPDVIKAFLDAKVDDDRHNLQANKASKPTFEALCEDSEPIKWKSITHTDKSGVEVVDSYTLNYLGYEAEVSEYGPEEWSADLFNSNTQEFVSIDSKHASQIYSSSEEAMKKIEDAISKDLNNDDAPLTEGAKPKAWYESHDYINYLSQKGLPVEGRFYDEIKYVNDFPVIDSGLSSEHTRYRNGWAGYAWYSVDENGEKVDYFYPVYVTNKSHKILLKDPTAWNFIRDSGPLPELSE